MTFSVVGSLSFTPLYILKNIIFITTTLCIKVIQKQNSKNNDQKKFKQNCFTYTKAISENKTKFYNNLCSYNNPHTTLRYITFNSSTLNDIYNAP